MVHHFRGRHLPSPDRRAPGQCGFVDWEESNLWDPGALAGFSVSHRVCRNATQLAYKLERGDGVELTTGRDRQRQEIERIRRGLSSRMRREVVQGLRWSKKIGYQGHGGVISINLFGGRRSRGETRSEGRRSTDRGQR